MTLPKKTLGSQRHSGLGANDDVTLILINGFLTDSKAEAEQRDKTHFPLLPQVLWVLF
ncbi:hypothetical protein FA13DRAFT_1729381 [Coprinellus micaceus]|uniref:Uncharacterized protein n=1 Tax=Coprinellus micaceus TaxID=71717 RepID=A0A4Y7TLC4_COPMI|nr:hypothetical protein FA13DRAFT_1729381 [Coprinellus micaceus]